MYNNTYYLRYITELLLFPLRSQTVGSRKIYAYRKRQPFKKILFILNFQKSNVFPQLLIQCLIILDHFFFLKTKLLLENYFFQKIICTITCYGTQYYFIIYIPTYRQVYWKNIFLLSKNFLFIYCITCIILGVMYLLK